VAGSQGQQDQPAAWWVGFLGCQLGVGFRVGCGLEEQGCAGHGGAHLVGCGHRAAVVSVSMAWLSASYS